MLGPSHSVEHNTVIVGHRDSCETDKYDWRAYIKSDVPEVFDVHFKPQASSVAKAVFMELELKSWSGLVSAPFYQGDGSARNNRVDM
jgi:hypothetical protein